MKTLESAFLAGANWFEMKSRFAGEDALNEAASEYAEGSEVDAERNLNRAIEAETELRKAKELLQKARRAVDPSCSAKDLRSELDEYLK